ncbi:MAG: type II toxin-antitoxin system RelE/ParE family toxin [Proteobacteria bacterium]|nr:type II toxin-antitoxin system RelE/ParE family toxin [Pseudomonadota bacterium]
MKVLQTKTFLKQKKKLKPNQLKYLDETVRNLVKDPTIGKQKIGDLKNIWIYKFKIFNQLYLLAYQWDEISRTLIALGVHENFYRDLKRK